MISTLTFIPLLAILSALPSFSIPTDAYTPAAVPAPMNAGAAASVAAGGSGGVDEGKLQSILWASWTAAGSKGPAPTGVAPMASGGEMPKHGSGSMPVTDLNSCLQVSFIEVFSIAET